MSDQELTLEKSLDVICRAIAQSAGFGIIKMTNLKELEGAFAFLKDFLIANSIDVGQTDDGDN